MLELPRERRIPCYLMDTPNPAGTCLVLNKSSCIIITIYPPNLGISNIIECKLMEETPSPNPGLAQQIFPTGTL